MKAKHVGVLAGAFNPVTRAHMALAEAALNVVDEVICVVPRVYPHKHFHGAALEERVEMLRLASPLYKVQVTEGGLFIDITRELRRPDHEISFICGRDAAERIIHWDYGETGAIEKMLEEFSLLVAERGGMYQAPAHLRHRVHHMELGADFSEVSSTEVRRRIGAGEPWEHLIPPSIADHVRRIYAA
ncbi:MAG: nicotinate-nicotinamide nucleotide adenylyltransferase [Bryobacteraceae bacterium]